MDILLRSAMQTAIAAACAAVLLAHASDGIAGDKNRAPRDDLYVAECGSCHVAFPPNLLPPPAWRQLLAGLERHFGADASIDAKAAARIGAYLERYGGRKPAPFGAAAPRITETTWFAHEHREVAAATWRQATVKSRANCAACHTQAEAGSFRERDIRIPR